MVAVVGVVSLLALAGCTDAPEEPLPIPTSSKTAEPTPTPEYTPGVDPEADVAAAIKTYEAYVEAENGLVVSDRSTWDPYLDLLVGEMRDGTLARLTAMAEDGTSLSGETRILSTSLFGQDAQRVVLDVCLDIGDTDIVGKDGLSLVSADRDPISAMRVRVVPGDDTSSWNVDYIIFRDDGPTC